MFPELTRDDVFRIETARLWLRWPRLADAAVIARLAGEKTVAEMTARIPVGMTEQDAVAYVLGARQTNADGAGLMLVMTLKRRPDDVIGSIGAHAPAPGALSLGYWLAQDHWGKGFATEAAQAIVDATFCLAATNELEARAVSYNTASVRVLKKCGFAHTGGGLADAPARGGAQAVDFFRLDRSTWAALKGWREPRFHRQSKSSLQTMAVA